MESWLAKFKEYLRIWRVGLPSLRVFTNMESWFTKFKEYLSVWRAGLLSLRSI